MSIETNTNNKKVSSTFASSDIFPRETNWKRDLDTYQRHKQNLEWGSNPKPDVITKKIMSERENIFDVITQKYNDVNFDRNLMKQAKVDLTNTIAKCYDNELRKEQTYDIITLKDRLKGFENDPNYPHMKKEKIKLNKEVSNVNYNILSNLSLNKHHYDAPEKRPKDTDSNQQIKPQIVNALLYKDYDIISNKYKVYDKEKRAVDEEIEKLNAAKKLYKARDYDTIRGFYYDPEKQRRYEEQIKEKNEKIRKDAKQNQMYDLINNEIYNKERLAQFDQRNKNLKMRYSLKPKIEEFYMQRNCENELRRDNLLSNRLSYNRYRLQDQRGYDFINQKDTYNKYKSSIECKDKKSEWDLLKENAGQNETFSTKKIYKAPYDKSDVGNNQYEYMKRRSMALKSLSPIETESQYQVKQIRPKSIHTSIEVPHNQFNTGRVFSVDKSKWFCGGKNYTMSNSPILTN